MPKLSRLELRILSTDESRNVHTLLRGNRLPCDSHDEIPCISLSGCPDQWPSTWPPPGGQILTRHGTRLAPKDENTAVMPGFPRPPAYRQAGDPLPEGEGGKEPLRHIFTVTDHCVSLSHSLEPRHLAEVLRTMDVNHLVITSRVWDDEPDGGAARLLDCIRAARAARPGIAVEILVPHFREKLEQALDVLVASPPDLISHNLDTVPRLYRKIHSGADYEDSLDLLQRLARHFPKATTTSGLFVGIGEELEEIRAVMRDLRAHHCRVLTIRQYFTPAHGYLPVERHVRPEELDGLRAYGKYIGFTKVACVSSVRSPGHDDLPAAGILSATKPDMILIVDGTAGGRHLVTAVGTLTNGLGSYGPCGHRDYRLMIDNQPIVSRLNAASR